MKLAKLIPFLLLISSFPAISQQPGKSLDGLWIGTYGNDQKEAPYYFSMRFFADGRVDVLNQNNNLIGAGSYSWQNQQFRITYKYSNDLAQYECLGNPDASASILSGSWRRIEDAGTKRSFTQNGRWILQKQNAPVMNRLIKDTLRLQTVIKNVNPAVLSSAFWQSIRTCTELPPQNNRPLPPRAASNASTYIRINPDGTLSNVGVTRQPLATYTDKMWEPGQSITVGFDITGGSIDQIEQVKRYAKEWELFANIKFDFQNNGNGMIRVGFKPNGSWSQIGRDALNVSSEKTTMNFGWLGSVNAGFARQVILHEFGHALGFIHEHQRVDAIINWDKEKVYTYFAQPPNNWSREMTDQQIFQKYASSGTNYSTYDQLSIMQYPVPAELTKDGSRIDWNMDLSATDKQYAGLYYPFPPNPPTATGILKTGDDCDEVAFSVEYGLVQRDQVEIIFELGQKNGTAVSWWKQIIIPLTNNQVYPMEIQNHSLIQAENIKTVSSVIPLNRLNKQRGISFAKAKLLGVHTPLSYSWNVLPAIQGGCRIRLTWIKDKCP